jgi:Flp pilus assembly protein TadD
MFYSLLSKIFCFAMKIDIQDVLMAGVKAHQTGDLNAAASSYQKILEIAPGHADANHLLGLVYFQSDHPSEAEQLIRKAISIDANVPLYHANLGRVLKSVDDNAGAVSAFRNAVVLSPDDAILHADLSSALLGAGDPDGARARAHLALELQPDLAEAHLNLGLALQDLHGPTDEEAEKHLRRAVELNPELAGSYLALGVSAHEKGQEGNAIAYYINALRLNPEFVEAHTNLGNIYRMANAFDDAVNHYHAALGIRDDNPHIWGNLGVALQEQGHLDDALTAYDCGIALSPDDPEILRNRGMARLLAGHFTEGWRDYRHRWKTPRFRELEREWPCPEWTGEGQKGAHILVHAEQGFGDTIQFARYLRELRDHGFKVHFECPDVIQPLFKGADFIKSLITPGEAFPKTDFHVPLLNLPGILSPDYVSEPYADPYLAVPKSARKKWQGIMRNWPSGKRVGISWRGNPDHVRDDLRSPGLVSFSPLFDLEGVQLVSLQKDNAADDTAKLSSGHRLIDPTDQIIDFGDTAALMMELDAIISCDSAPLHLAGALGCQTFALLPYIAEWRWGKEDETTPWYPSMKLFRQSEPGDWPGVMDRAVEDLKSL